MRDSRSSYEQDVIIPETNDYRMGGKLVKGPKPKKTHTHTPNVMWRANLFRLSQNRRIYGFFFTAIP